MKSFQARFSFFLSLTIFFVGAFTLISVAHAATDVYIPKTGFPLGTGFNGPVLGMVQTSTGKLVIVGNFTSYNGTAANDIIELNQDGTINTGFVTGTGLNDSNDVTLLLNSDDTVIVTGNFNQYNGTTVGHMIKLNTDGSLNTAFMTNAGTGFDNRVISATLDPSGNIYAIGDFLNYNSHASSHVGSVSANGTFNSSFNVGSGFTVNQGSIFYYVGKILIYGPATTYNGTSIAGPVVYLNLDGTINNSLPIFNNSVTSVAVDGNGKTVVAGNFSAYGPTTTSNFIRVNSSGAIDNTFTQSNFEGGASAVVFDPQNRVIVLDGGYGFSQNGPLYFSPQITRFTSTGAIDSTLDSGLGLSGGSPNAMVLLSNGDLVVGGAFTGYYNGSAVNYIVRLTPVLPSVGDTVATDTGTVAYNDANLYYSPYTWKQNAASMETNDGGAYIKIAFTGSTLKLGLNLYGMESVPLPELLTHTYIDGSSTPVTDKFTDVSNGELTIATNLSAGNHYAVIYVASVPAIGKAQNGATYSAYPDAAWREPNLRLRVTHIELANNGTGHILTLAGTPIAPGRQKVLFFGDSITLFSDDAISDTAYSADLGHLLGVDYGQVAFGNLGWNTTGSGGVPNFYDNVTPTNSSWRYYASSSSRLVGNQFSGGFVGGAPSAVFINIGTNDELQSTNLTLARTKVALFLADLRQSIGTLPAIFLIAPFHFYADTAWSGGVSDYQTAHPTDTRIYFLNLGNSGDQIVLAHTSDFIHPDPTGSTLIAQALLPLSSPYITDYVTLISSVVATVSSNSATITWLSDGLGSSIVQYGSTANYTASTTESDTSVRVYSHSVTVSGLASCTQYHFDVVSKDSIGDRASSTDSTFTTTGCSSGGGGGGSGGGGGGSTTVSSGGTTVTRGTVVNRGTIIITPPTNGIVTTLATSTISYMFSRDLTIGSQGDDVKNLQVYLNTAGFSVAPFGQAGSSGLESTYFGLRTQKALANFQKQYQIFPPLGYFGPLTRHVVNFLLSARAILAK